MMRSPANYHAISPVQGHCSDTNEVGVSGDSGDLHPTRISSETLSRWTYFLLGCAILLPWNVLVSGTPFFLSRLADSPFRSTFSSYLSSVFTVTKLFCLVYCTITSKQSSPSRRIFASIITAILLIISLCLSTFIRGTPSAFFSFALFNTASLAVTSSYLYAAVCARAALLGPSFLQSTLSGQAAISVVISAVQVVSAVISLGGLSAIPTASVEIVSAYDGDNQAEEVAARIFFGVSTLFLGITLAAYTCLTRQTFYKSAISAVKQHGGAEDTDEPTGLVADDRRRIPVVANSRVYLIIKQNWIIMFSIAYVYTVTLAVYPAITVRVQSVNPAIPSLLFTAVHFLVFNIGDLVGRHTCSSPRMAVWSANKILAMSLIRTLFVPLILLCNVSRAVTVPPVSPIVDSDTLFMSILFTMGFTNGFVACTAMLAVSSLEHNPGLKGRREDVDVAATLGGTFVVVGLASGALSSFSVEALI